MQTSPAAFAAEMERLVFGDAEARHPAVDHRFLRRFAAGDFDRRRLHAYAINHYPLVEHFTKYLEYLLPLAPSRTPEDWRLKSLIAENLFGEYGEAVLGEDHPRLFVRFARSVGIEETLGLPRDADDAAVSDAMLAHPLRLPAPAEFAARHDALCRGDFLAGLGAVGPGHEWAIPTMFRAFVEGLRRFGAAHGVVPNDVYYATHIEVDVEHGAMLRELLLHHAATAESRARIRAGAEESLRLRAALWTAIDRLWDRI